MSIHSMLLRANHALIVARPEIVQTASGGVGTRGWNYVGSMSPAWVQPVKTGTRLAYMQRELTVTHRVYTDVDPGLKVLDVLLFGNLSVFLNYDTLSASQYDTLSAVRYNYMDGNIATFQTAYIYDSLTSFQYDTLVALQYDLLGGPIPQLRTLRVIGVSNTVELNRLWSVDCEEISLAA